MRSFKIIFICLITALLLCAVPVSGSVNSSSVSVKSDPVRIMFIGNSMTMSSYMPDILGGIAKAKGKNVEIDLSASYYGVSLQYHWEAGKANKLIAKGNWDYVSFQDGVNAMRSRPTYDYRYFMLFDREVRAVGGRTIVYQTNLQRGMDDKLIKDTGDYEYKLNKELARRIDGLFVPAGMAWQKMAQKSPETELFLPNDGAHPGPLGAYLTACVFYASIFNESPEGAPVKFMVGPDKSIEFDFTNQPELIKLIQKTAWETVKESRSQK